MNYARVLIVLLFISLLFLFSGKDTYALSTCTGALQCYNEDKIFGGCLSTSYTENCSGTDQSTCLNSVQCGPCGQAGGTGCSWNSSIVPTPTDTNNYVYTKCPTGEALSCGTQAEAIAQNKNDCIYRITCNKYFWESKISTACSVTNPALATCDWNCSCCPTGTVRSCTLGATYVKNITISEPFMTAANEAAKVTCNTHDHIFLSNTKLREYTDRWGTRYQDWRLNCRVQTCSCSPPCVESPPVAPVLVAPAGLAEIPVGVATLFDWDPTTDWGINCPTNTNSYQINIPIDPPGVPITWLNRNLTTQYNWTPTAPDPDVLWCVRANNGGSTAQRCRRVCVEGGVTYGTWSTCVDHKRWRTCTETCGTDDCIAAGAVGGRVTEDCIGTIQGVLFDASDYSSCPTDLITNPSNYSDILITNRSFAMTSPFVAPTWPGGLTNPRTITTDVNGFYTLTAYAPGTYTYDFSALEGMYSGTNDPKLKCTSAEAGLPGCNTTDMTQPCATATLPYMSFGFARALGLGGWWQVKGGSIHAENGIKSSIPATLPTEQSLILPDATLKRGILSYGVPWVGTFLGTNPAAQVSSMKWRKQSSYTGPIYDYDFYNNRFNLFTVTPWDVSHPLEYTSLIDYQIFKRPSGAGNFQFSPTGTQKAIFLVNGDVRVTSDIIVPNGAFLMIIASGSIIFDPSTPSDPGVTRADGWFVADNIQVLCEDNDGTPGCDNDDDQFTGNGTFIGWENVSLSRSMGAGNSTAPAELFTYRRDLYDNAPEPVKIYTKFYQPFIP